MPKYIVIKEYTCQDEWLVEADDKQQADDRINFLLKKLGDRKMTYVMALLMLPYLMEMVENSKEYKDYFEERKKRLN